MSNLKHLAQVLAAAEVDLAGYYRADEDDDCCSRDNASEGLASSLKALIPLAKEEVARLYAGFGDNEGLASAQFLAMTVSQAETAVTEYAELSDCCQRAGRAGDLAGYLSSLMSSLWASGQWEASDARTWTYGLTADEWLHLAAEGDKSELQPCCANLSRIRELAQTLATDQDPDAPGFRRMWGKDLIAAVEEDGDGHGLQDREKFPLLWRVIDGIRAELEEA